MYVKNDEKGLKTIDIIDGQQRITTVLITLAIIRDKLQDFEINLDLEEGKKILINRNIFRIDQAIKSENSQVKLTTENETNFENIFIESILKSIFDFEEGESPRKEYESQAKGSKNRFDAKKRFMYNYKGDARKTRHKLAYKNYILINNRFKSHSQRLDNNEDEIDYLINSSKTLMDNFRVINFEVDSYERAFEYFEVLNDRGLDVSALDLIKNQCLKIKGINKDQRQDIFNYWSEIFSETLDHTYNLIQFIRYAYMSQWGHITNKQIFASYKQIIEEMTYRQVSHFLKSNLKIKAITFKSLLSQDCNENALIHNSIQLLDLPKR